MRLRSRKGVSGAISAMFVIAIFFIILVSLFVYTGLLNSYNQTVTDRNRMDWERDSESIFFIAAEVKSGVLNLNFSNNGGVTLHLVQVWLSQFPNNSYSESKNQSQYWTSKYVSSGQTVGSFGATEDFKRINIGSIGAPIRLSGLSGEYHKIKLVTERGNVFECQVPYPPETVVVGGGSGFYPVVIAAEHTNFQYQDTNYANHVWKSAWIKKRSSPASWHVVYRVLINNTTVRDIDLDLSTFMLQSAGTGDETRRYVVSSTTDIDNDYPTIFSGQTISKKSWDYVCFAAKTKGVTNSDWMADPNLTDAPVSFVINFWYADEPHDADHLRTLGLPVQVQQFT